MSIAINIFDIETAPNPDKVKAFTKPFHKDDVKLGNLKDPEKIAAKLATAEDDYWTRAHDRAALDPFTSEIVAIGMHLEDAEDVEIVVGAEEYILTEFWHRLNDRTHQAWCYYTGSNNKTTFDPRHIIARSWVNRVPVPHGIISDRGYLSGCFVDLAQIFLAGADYPSFVSADMCVKQLGLIGDESIKGCPVRAKTEIEEALGINGKDFHAFLRSDDPAKQEAAYTYLINDIAIERAIANVIL